MDPEVDYSGQSGNDSPVANPTPDGRRGPLESSTAQQLPPLPAVYKGQHQAGPVGGNVAGTPGQLCNERSERLSESPPAGR